MNIIPILFILILLFISSFFYSWCEIIAFALVVIFAPLILMFLIEAFEVLFQNKESDFAEIFPIAGLYALVGIPIYFVFIMPIYYGLLRLTSVPITLVFPIVVSIIMLSIFIFLTTKPWGYVEVLVIIGCSVFHTLSILWLISKFRLLTV